MFTHAQESTLFYVPLPLFEGWFIFYVCLVKIIAFRQLLDSENFLRWYWNYTDGSILWSPAFYWFLLMKKIKWIKLNKISMRSICFLKKGSKVTKHQDSHGIPTYIVRNWYFLNWYDEKGIRYKKNHSLVDLAWWSSISCCVSREKKTTYKYTMKKYDIYIYSY